MKQVAFPIVLLLSACQNVSQTVIPEEPSCPHCTIDIRTVATIGDVDGPGILEGRPGSINVDEKGRYFVETGRPPMSMLPKVFDADGRFVRVIGRNGAGPGELRGRVETIPLPGDSVLVLQPDISRASVFGPDYVFSRQIRFPGASSHAVVVRWPDSVLIVGLSGDQDQFEWPVHMASLRGTRAQLTASARSKELGKFEWSDWRMVAVSSRSPWWILRGPYRLTKFDAGLRPIQSLERKPDWWSEGLSLGVPHKIPPHPSVTAVTVDSEGLLWVFIRVAAKNWREGWAEVPPGLIDHIPAKLIRYQKLFSTTVEVIDPTARRVLARATFERFVISALPGRRAVEYIENEDGVPRVNIIELLLVR